MVGSGGESEGVGEIVQRHNPSQQQAWVLAFDEHVLTAAQTQRRSHRKSIPAVQ